jgi:hypothetical protein
MFALAQIDSRKTNKTCVNIFVSKKIDTGLLTQFCVSFYFANKTDTLDGTTIAPILFLYQPPKNSRDSLKNEQLPLLLAILPTKSLPLPNICYF